MVAMPTGRLTCDKKRCHILDNILRDVTAVNVSAYTAHGATTPARLYMPLSGNIISMNDHWVHLSSDRLVQLHSYRPLVTIASNVHCRWFLTWDAVSKLVIFYSKLITLPCLSCENNALNLLVIFFFLTFTLFLKHKKTEVKLSSWILTRKLLLCFGNCLLNTSTTTNRNMWCNISRRDIP